MIAIYIASMGEAAGKSAFCVALGKIFIARGLKVGYLKPVAVIAEKSDASAKDTEFIKRTLSLEEPVELLCPVSLSAKDFLASVNEKEPAWMKKAKEAFDKVSQGKDVILLEGVNGFKLSDGSAIAGRRIVDVLEAKAILIASYESGLQESQIVDAAKGLAGRLLGVVINAVPQRRLETVKAKLVKSVEKNSIRVLGTLPEERTLLTVSVGELAEHLDGNIINAPERSDNQVEAVMVGAMSPDPAVSYLSIKQNKAVVTRGDRPDIQLAALQTSTSCLVLTNNINQPLPTIMNLAKTTKIPIVIVKNDTLHTMETLEGIFDKAKLSHEWKVQRFEQLIEQHLDLESIYKAAKPQ